MFASRGLTSSMWRWAVTTVTLLPLAWLTVALLTVALLAGCGSSSEPSTLATASETPSPVADRLESTATVDASPADVPSSAETAPTPQLADDDSVDEDAVAPISGDSSGLSVVPAVDLGAVESSRGAGSLLLAASEMAVSADAYGGVTEWIPGLAAGLPDLPECRSATTLAERATVTFSPVPQAAEVGYADNVTHVVEVHVDEAAAVARVEAVAGDQRHSCQEATFAMVQELPLDPTGLIRFESEDRLGTELAPDGQPQGVRTVAFDWSLVGPSGAVAVTRTVSVWNFGPVVHVLEVGTTGNTNASLIDAAHRVTVAAAGSPGGPTRNPELDAAVNRVRRGVETADLLAGFYTRIAALEFATAEAAGEPSCANDYTAGSVLVESSGPSWASPNGASLLAQGASVFVDRSAAQAELDRSEATAAKCIEQEVLPALIGPSEPIGSAQQRRTVTTAESATGSVEVFSVTVDVVQTVTGQSGDVLTADARAQLVLAVDGDLLESWLFVGLVGDEPDLEQLALDAISSASGAK